MILRELMAAAGSASNLLAQLTEQSTDASAAPWLIILGRAVARGEASPEALHPRVATVAIVLLRNEFVTRGVPTSPDEVLIEIVDEVYLPLVRARHLPLVVPDLDAIRHRAYCPIAVSSSWRAGPHPDRIAIHSRHSFT